MLFNSLEFATFLIIVLSAYYVLAKKQQNIVLLISSYVFYGFWDWRFLSLIFISTLVDYTVARRIERTESLGNRKKLLLVSLLVNLGLLGTFKYFNFFIDTFIDFGALLGLNFDTPALRLLPPVGISFYTFQTLSYTIDVYRGNFKAERNFITFAVFVSYFPQLVAGPIERASHFLPQLNSHRKITETMLVNGVLLIVIGLFKKLAIADNAGIHVDIIFSDAGNQTTWTLWKGAILFSIQIYGDFSGYSNMARGISLMFGIRLVENFKTPFFAHNISDFWRRWHISLSQWLRDYLYISLGGNRRGSMATYRNLMLTMLLGGLWHGASWTYIVWGALHGIYLMLHRWWNSFLQMSRLQMPRWIPASVGHVLSIIITFIVVTIAFVVFRADSIYAAFDYIVGLFNVRGELKLSDVFWPAMFLLLLLPIEFTQYRNDGDVLAIRRFPLVVRSSLYFVMCIAIILTSNNEIPFIYFQF